MQDTNLPPLPKSAKAQRTRQKILEAARAILAERGFAKATAEEISTKAGVGYGTFYLYFADKRQALHTILSEVDDQLYQLGQAEGPEKPRLGLGALAPIKVTISGLFDSFKVFSNKGTCEGLGFIIEYISKYTFQKRGPHIFWKL